MYLPGAPDQADHIQQGKHDYPLSYRMDEFVIIHILSLFGYKLLKTISEWTGAAAFTFITIYIVRQITYIEYSEKICLQQ